MKMTLRLLFLLIAVCPIPLLGLDNAIIFTGNANPELAKKVATLLDMEVGDALVTKFNDGEIRIRINDNVRNKDVYVIQSTCPSSQGSINDNIMELYLMVRALKRASTKSITIVTPYYGYARQDRKCEPRVPISAADVAMLMETAGADRVVCVDLHAGQIQGFFRDIPVDNLFASIIFVPHFAKMNLQNVVVVSPDAGGVTRANEFLKKLKEFSIEGEMAMISKQRKGAGVIDTMQLIGDVEGADAIIVDDLCDTAGTLVKAAQLLKDSGARRVFAAVTHPVFSGEALERIAASPIDEIMISDSIELDSGAPSNVKQISVAPLLAEAIRRINKGESLSILF